MARPNPRRCVLSKKIVSPIAMASTMETASSAKPLIDSVSTVSRRPANSTHPTTMSAVSVVRAALSVSVPSAGASALTIKLVTDHASADPSAQSAPTVSFIESADLPESRAPSSHQRNAWRGQQNDRGARPTPRRSLGYDPGFKEPPEKKRVCRTRDGPRRAARWWGPCRGPRLHRRSALQIDRLHLLVAARTVHHRFDGESAAVGRNHPRRLT